MLPHAFYINLNRRTDRRMEFESECDHIGISAERFSAIEWNPGDVGCLKSHIAVLKEAQKRHLSAVLIFEDDFQFLVSKELFYERMSSIQSIRYDVIMLSYNIQHCNPVTEYPHLGKILEAQTASGYLVHSCFFEKLIHIMETSLPLLETTRQHWLYAADQCWKPLQPITRWYYFLDRIGKQRESYSDLAGCIVNYNC